MRIPNCAGNVFSLAFVCMVSTLIFVHKQQAKNVLVNKVLNKVSRNVLLLNSSGFSVVLCGGGACLSAALLTQCEFFLASAVHVKSIFGCW